MHNIGRKDRENQWRIADLEFPCTALSENINVATSLEHYSVLVEKEQWSDFYMTGYCECVIRFRPRLISKE